MTSLTCYFDACCSIPTKCSNVPPLFTICIYCQQLFPVDFRFANYFLDFYLRLTLWCGVKILKTVLYNSYQLGTLYCFEIITMIIIYTSCSPSKFFRLSRVRWHKPVTVILSIMFLYNPQKKWCINVNLISLYGSSTEPIYLPEGEVYWSWSKNVCKSRDYSHGFFNCKITYRCLPFRPLSGPMFSGFIL